LQTKFRFFQPKDQSFVFPNLFKDSKSELDEETMNESKRDLQEYVKVNKAPGLPGWFRI